MARANGLMKMATEAEIVLEVLARRRSVRKFIDRPLPDNIVESIIERGRLAQSADNRQPWHFIVLRENRSSIADLFRQTGFAGAPLLIVLLADRQAAWRRSRHDDANYAEVDCAIAATEMITAATAFGVGSCWVASIDSEEVKKRLGAPAELHLAAVLAFGYPEEPLDIRPKKRKEAAEVVHREKWTPPKTGPA